VPSTTPHRRRPFLLLVALLVVGLLVESIGVGPAYLVMAALLAAVSLAMILTPGIRELDHDLPR
jgi:hypothetical protein